MDIYRGRVGTSRGGPTPPSGKVPHPTPPGASPPRPLRPGQVAGAQGGARALFEGNLGPSLSRLSGRGKGRASVSWRSSGWRLVVLPLGVPRNPGDHHKPSPFWMVERRERGSEFALSGVRSTLLGSSLSSEGGGVRGSRGMCLPGECCVVGRQRVQRAGGHQKGTSKEGHAASRCFVLGWCRMGAAARRAWGVSVVQTRGVFGSLVEKAGWSVGCSLRGASCMLLPFSAWGSTPPGAAQTPRHLQRHCKRASAGGSADCIRA